GVMADQLERTRILARKEFDSCVTLDTVGEVGHDAVERHRHGALRQRGRDARGDLESSDSGGEVPTGTVEKGERDHHALLLLTRCLRMQVSVSCSEGLITQNRR